MNTDGDRGSMLWETTVNQDGHTGVQWKYFWKGWLQDGTLTPEQVELRAQARNKQRHVTQRRVHAQRVLAQGGYGGAWGPRQREVLATLGDDAVSEALADRIVQLTRVPQVVSVNGEDKSRASLDYQWEAWWGQWQYLGDVVYHGVEAGLLDIDRLTKCIVRRGVQDNAAIWIIGQCTLLDKMKTISPHDLMSVLMTATVKLFNDKQCEDGVLFEPREVPLVWLWSRPSAALNVEIKKHAHKQIEKHIHHISELYKQLFQDIKQSGNFRKIDAALQNKICAFSSQGFQQVCGMFENNLLKIDLEHHQTALRSVLAQLPANVTTYSPPIAALPGSLYATAFLATLAGRCRYKLIHMLESTVGNVQLDSVPLSALETYVRLVYYLPAQSHQTLLEHYYKADQSRLHMLTELFTHRLYRFMLSQDMHDHLLNHVLRHLALTTHAQNYDSLQTLALRLATHLQDPYYFKKRHEMVSVPEPLDDTRQDYGEPVNRMLTLALARTIKLRGLRDMQHVSELHAHLTQLHQLTGHVWPVETSALFPKVVQTFYQDKARVYLPTNSDRVNEELRLVMSLNEPQLREYFSKDEKQLYLLPILLRAYPVITPATVLLINKLHVNELMHTITPQRWSKLSYWLVDYLLDTLTAEQLAGSDVNGEQLEFTAQKLGHLIWDHAVLSLHTVLMALADSLVLPRALDTQHNAAVNRFNIAIQLIEYLLCKEPTVLACRDAFIALQPNVDHWREDEPHKLREFLAKFPGRYVRTANNTPMCSYYGNTYLNLLPVLDYLIGRLIEVDQPDFLNYLMEYYSTLYRYHPAALTFLYETLFYYYEAPAFSSVRPDTSGKLIFFQLLVQSKVSFTSHLLHQFLQNMSEIDLTEQYFNDLLATLHIIDQGAEASIWSPFEELGGVSTVQHQYTCAAIELMAVTNAANPRTPLWIFTPQQLVQWPKQLGKLFALLPRAFQDEFERQLVLYHRSIRDSLLSGCSWAWRWQEASSIDHVTFMVPANSSVAHSDSTVSNLATVSMSSGTTEERLLWLVHSYYSLASPDTLLNYVTILRQIRDVDPMSQRANQPINSVAHLLLIVKSIAPYLPVLAKTPNQEYLQAVLVELLTCFNDAEYFMDSLFAAGYTADRDNELLDIIIDFFAHCKAALQLTAPVIEAMRGVIRGLNIELRRRFKGI